MSGSIDVPVDEVKRVFEILSKLNAFFHQPMKYEDLDLVRGFADSNYGEIRDLYYKVVWEWLPAEVKDEIENG